MMDERIEAAIRGVAGQAFQAGVKAAGAPARKRADAELAAREHAVTILREAVAQAVGAAGG